MYQHERYSRSLINFSFRLFLRPVIARWGEGEGEQVQQLAEQVLEVWMEHLMEEAQVEGRRVEVVDGVNTAPVALDPPEWAWLVTDRRRSNTSFWYPQPKQALSSAKVMNIHFALNCSYNFLTYKLTWELTFRRRDHQTNQPAVWSVLWAGP